MTMDLIEYFRGLGKVIEKLDLDDVERVISTLREAGKEGKMIFFIGNGGSASLATHMAADIGKNTLNAGQKIRYKTLALTDNTAWITALGNDMGYEEIFVEQLKNFSKSGDVLFAISGKGNSRNIILALQWAKKKGLKTIGLLGFGGGKAARIVDMMIVVPADNYAYVEGIHSEIHHCVVEALKEFTQPSTRVRTKKGK